ncbi:MAG: small, acid-soluble spore protein, alpha/beta type [Cellulosilyticaceae bacterium]
MSNKETKEKLFNALSPDQQMKLEIAEELGLLDKIQEGGWKNLTPKETGRIGGLMTKKKREMKAKEQENNA